MYQKAVLDNGVRVLTSSMPHTRSVTIRFFVGVGSRYESDAEAGSSHFIEHLLFRGTDKRKTARQISEAVEGVGGILNGGTDTEVTSYWCKVPQPHFSGSLDVLADMLLHSRFDPGDVEKERQIIIEEINMVYDTPSQRVGLLIDELLWPGHPLGRDIAGSKQSITAATRESILGYMAGHYLPANTVVSIAGNIKHKEALAAVKQVLGSWTGERQPPVYKAYRAKKARRLSIERRDIEQVHLCLALPGLSRLHPGRFTLDLLNVVLGEGMSSRLFSEIRDRLGLAYSIYSYVEHFHDTGAVTVYAAVEPGNLKVAVKAVLEQLYKFKEESVSDTELTKAKEMAKGRLLLRMEDSRSVAGWMGGQEILTGRVLSVDQVLAIVDAITAEEVKQLAGELIATDQFRLALVGPVAKDESLKELLML